MLTSGIIHFLLLETRLTPGNGLDTQDEELMRLLNFRDPNCYDGFEPSGRMHIAQVHLLIRALIM
jgi:hypothetical protein